MGRPFVILCAALFMAQPAASAEEEVLRQQHRANELMSSWLSGAVVRGADGERIGTVRNLILDEESGRITAVVVATGGVLGFGGKDVGLRWDQLRIEGDGRELLVDMPAREAEDAPVFDFRDRLVRPPESPSTEPQPASELPGSQ